MRHYIFFVLLAVGPAFYSCQSTKQDASLEANRALVKRYHDVFSSGKTAELDQLLTPDCIYHFTNGKQQKGIDSTKFELTEARKLFPDLTHEVLDMVAEGDRVAARYKVTATHQRKFKDFSPTGNKVVINAAAVYRIANGKIAEEWGFVNPSDLDNQLKAKN